MCWFLGLNTSTQNPSGLLVVVVTSTDTCYSFTSSCHLLCIVIYSCDCSTDRCRVTWSIPSCVLFEPLHNVEELGPFFRVVVPAVNHEIDELAANIYLTHIGAERWVFMRHNTLDDLCWIC